MNASLGPALDREARADLFLALGMDRLRREGLTERSERADGPWWSCGFCVFPGVMTPDVRQHASNDACFAAIRDELRTLRDGGDLTRVAPGGVLVTCFSHAAARGIHDVLASAFGDDVQLRSGGAVNATVKRRTRAVEPGRINIALVQDAKGYDADVVYVVNPDGARGAPMVRRAGFYVAATRARQFLAVHGAVPLDRAPIMRDAMRAASAMRERCGA